MFKKMVIFCTVFLVLYIQYGSSSIISIPEKEKDIDLISEIIKLREGITNETDILTSTSSDSKTTRSVVDEKFAHKNDNDNWTHSNSPIFRMDEKSTSTDSIAANDVMPTTLKKENCEMDSDCLNGGTCRNEEGQKSCDCAPNFEGFWCEISLLCVGMEQSCRIINSVCVVVDNHAICECPNGTLYHRKSGLCEDICDPRKCLHGTCEIIARTYKCNCDRGYTGSHCDETERVHHENSIPWFSVIASIGLFMCVLQIAMFCVVCQIKTFISSS